MTVGWKDGCGLQNKFDSQAKADFEADATLTAEATALMDVRLGFKSVSCSLVNAQFTSGAVAVGKTETDLLGDQPTCVDLRLYVPLRWGVNQEGCLLTDISGKLKAKRSGSVYVYRTDNDVGRSFNGSVFINYDSFACDDI